MIEGIKRCRGCGRLLLPPIYEPWHEYCRGCPAKPPTQQTRPPQTIKPDPPTEPPPPTGAHRRRTRDRMRARYWADPEWRAAKLEYGRLWRIQQKKLREIL